LFNHGWEIISAAAWHKSNNFSLHSFHIKRVGFTRIITFDIKHFVLTPIWYFALDRGFDRGEPKTSRRKQPAQREAIVHPFVALATISKPSNVDIAFIDLQKP
jgi:hypothetical protein